MSYIKKELYKTNCLIAFVDKKSVYNISYSTTIT